jgi:hypothetical protein
MEIIRESVFIKLFLSVLTYSYQLHHIDNIGLSLGQKPERALGVICYRSKLYHTNVRFGSFSEVITLDTPCSGDERKAEPICCQISSVFSSQFGHKQTFRVNQKHACSVCGQLGVLHGTILRLFTDKLWTNRLT